MKSKVVKHCFHTGFPLDAYIFFNINVHNIIYVYVLGAAYFLCYNVLLTYLL